VARRLAWIEMGSGALLPGGGVGSLAAGGVLLRRGGMSTARIVEKSSGLFFLTSGTNVLALVGAGLLLALGVGGGVHGALLALGPAAVAIAGAAIILVLPRSRWHRTGRSRALRSVVDGIGQAEQELVRPNWRLLGALGYLGFDIAVLGVTFAAVGRPVGVPALELAYIIGYAANSLPVPGGIGVLEGGLVGALVLYGAPVMPATAAVLIYHAIAFWVPSLGGAVAYGMVALADRARSLAAGATVQNRAKARRLRTKPADKRRGGAYLPRPEYGGNFRAFCTRRAWASREPTKIDRGHFSCKHSDPISHL
jgi:uncharacterized membrane protein YbhN (UPF0104 family)